MNRCALKMRPSTFKLSVLILITTARGADLAPGAAPLSHAERLIAAYPNSAAGYAARAGTLLSLGRPSEALADYRAALERDPGAIVVLVGYGEALNAVGQHVEAARVLRLALRIEPFDAGTRVALATAEFGLGRAPAALDELDSALGLDPGCLPALTMLTQHYLSAGCPDDAVAAAQRAAAARPRSAALHALLGSTLDQAGRAAEAEQAFRRAVELDGGDARARYGLGVVLFRQGKYDAAIEQYQAAVAADASLAHYWNNLGCALLELQRDGDAARAFRQALTLDPRDALAWSNLGSALERSGDRKGAIESYERAVAIEPGYARAHQRLAQAMIAAGRYADAYAHLNNAAAMVAADQRLGMANLVARLLAAAPVDTLRNAAQARRIAESLVRQTQEQSFEAYDTLAMACAEAGDFDAALRAIEQALRLVEKFESETLRAELQARRELYRQKKPYRLTAQ